MRHALLLVGAVLLAPSAFTQLLVPVSTTRDVLMFDAFDGSLLNAQFLDMNLSTGTAPATPQELIYAPNGDILISDQLADRIFRFSGDGSTYLGETSTPLDNLRGLESAYGSIWAANAGTGNGAPGRSIVQLDQNLDLVAVHPLPFSPWDLQTFRRGTVDGLLVTTGGSTVYFFDPADPANPIEVIATGASTMAFNQYMNFSLPNGNLLIAGWSAPSGGYEFETTNFSQAGFIDIQGQFSISGVRSIYRLGNGSFLVSGPGIRVYDPVGQTLTDIVPSVAGRAITNMQSGGGNIGTNYCTATPNSTGAAGSIAALGSSVAADNNVTLVASSMPPGQFGIFVTSTTQDFVPNVGSGNLCLGGAIGRYQQPGQIQQIDVSGEFSLTIDTNFMPQGAGLVPVVPGETWSFQAWHRDFTTTPPVTNTSNLTDGIAITFN